jgi:hypothetical protein
MLLSCTQPSNKSEINSTNNANAVSTWQGSIEEENLTVINSLVLNDNNTFDAALNYKGNNLKFSGTFTMTGNVLIISGKGISTDKDANPASSNFTVIGAGTLDNNQNTGIINISISFIEWLTSYNYNNINLIRK